LFDESKIDTYRTFNIHTVDQLAKLNDAFITKIGMGTREDVKRANAYLATLNDKAKEEHLMKQLLERDERLAMLEQKLASLTNDAPKQRGRPPKGDTNDLSE